MFENIKVESKMMTKCSFYIVLLLTSFCLKVHRGVDAFHAPKPMIYINFFDEITENVSSKLNENDPVTASDPSTDLENLKSKSVSSEELPEVENEGGSPPPTHGLPFEFDDLSKTDITEKSSVKGGEIDTTPPSRDTDPATDIDLIAPEIGRIFFLRAITNLIQHIMEAFFSIDDARLNDSPGFDYDSIPSRKLKKRDLSDTEIETKSSDAGTTTSKNLPSIDSSTGGPSGLKDTSSGTDILKENTHVESTNHVKPLNDSELLRLFKKTNGNFTEHSSSVDESTLISGHVTSDKSTSKDVNHKSHVNFVTEPKSTDGATTGGTHKSLLKRKVPVADRKSAARARLQEQLKPTDEDESKMFRFHDESSVLHDEISEQNTHFYGGVHPAEEHDKYKFVENLSDKDDDYDVRDSSSLITLLLISTTLLIIIVLVTAGVVAAYFFRKSSALPGNQNPSNLHTALA